MPSIVAAEFSHRTAVNPIISEIVRMSRELFPGPVSVEVMSDPEAPGESWTVLNVEAKGDPKDIVKSRCEWHERLARQFPDAVSTVQLSICLSFGSQTDRHLCVCQNLRRNRGRISVRTQGVP